MIQQKIHDLRGQKVMLDYDLAALYEVPTGALNQAVKRNIDRFPEDFMFQLSKEEYECLRSQIVILKRGGHSKYNPYAFTEHGVTMVSIETLIDEKDNRQSWEERERIGFKN